MRMDIGFYDDNGVFFYEWENARPNEHSSYALAGAPEHYVLRINGLDVKLAEAEYYYILKKAKLGAFDAIP